MSATAKRPVTVATSNRPSGPWANAWVPVWDDQPAPKPARPNRETNRTYGSSK